MTDGLEHPPHLVLATFVDGDLDAPRAEPTGLRGARRAVVQLDPCAQPLERLLARVVLDFGLVDLLDLVARVREPVRELAVVR